jgi:hypothetical protein
MVMSSKLPARGHRVDGRAAETRLPKKWLSCFDGDKLRPGMLNRTLTGTSEWVHLGEIAVINAFFRGS